METTNVLGNAWQGSDYEFFKQKITQEYQNNLTEFTQR